MSFALFAQRDLHTLLERKGKLDTATGVQFALDIARFVNSLFHRKDGSLVVISSYGRRKLSNSQTVKHRSHVSLSILQLVEGLFYS